MVVDPALRLDGVTVGYGRTSVLAGLDLEVARGELVGVVGPSGAGKTTLLRLVTGQADLHAGTVDVLGRRLGRRTVPRGVGYVPQLEGIDWDFPLTVSQVVLLGGAADGRRVPWFSRAERRRAAAVLERLGMAAFADRQIRELSGGQQQRMFLARALARRCELLVLDEPTNGVDLATRRDVLGLLGDLREEGLTVLLTTHDLNFVALHLPRIVCLNGEVTADGDPRTVLDPLVLERTYGTPMRVVHDQGMVMVVDEAPVLPHRAADGPARPPVGVGER
jgi:ABC-type Mn2+/Zn2+ transport system ATPase subunit